VEKYDPQAAARVWQRVRGEKNEESGIGLQTLVAWEKEAEAMLLWLSKRLPEKGYPVQQMIADTRRHIACLQGIRQLSGEKPGTYSREKPLSGEPGMVLRKCYGHCLKVGAQYAARAEDETCGCVYADMARTKRRHCAMLLEILGGA